ncbi:phage major capsid protein [Bosea sp. RCC_152_1]|uniref:phage major capsid protein n=1 Tax=Bosea sp. RCC_152_1 TaxID=3239228 RepID=UPI003526014A
MNLAHDLEIKEDGDHVPADVAEALSKLTNSVDERLKAFETKSADASKLADRLSAIETRLNRPTGIETKSANDNADAEMKAFTSFVRTGDATEIKALAVGAPSTGGILAPQSVSASVLEKIAEFSPVRQLVAGNVINMSGPLLQLPRLVDEVEPGSVSETGARPESEPSFEQIDLKPFELAVTVPVTRVMLEDATIDMEGWLLNHIARRFGQKESSWFVVGNGLTQAEGVMVAMDIAEQESAITGDNLIDLFYSIKSGYAANGAWLMNRATMALVRKLKDGQGNYLWQSGITAGQPPQILGRPVYESVDMANPVAGASPIVFGDFSAGYTIAERVAFDSTRDEFTGADNGIVKLRARRRVGGRVTLPEAFVKLKVA